MPMLLRKHNICFKVLEIVEILYHFPPSTKRSEKFPTTTVLTPHDSFDASRQF